MAAVREDHLGRRLDCEVCGKDISKDRSRCTNARCGECHRSYCTGGGDTEPGHGRKWPADYDAWNDERQREHEASLDAMGEERERHDFERAHGPEVASHLLRP